MTNSVSSAFNEISKLVPNNIGATSVLSYSPPYSTVPEMELDFFESSDGEATKSAGAVLVIGLLVRKFLQEWSSKFFTNYFSKKNDIDVSEMKNIAVNMLKDKKLMEQPTLVQYKDGQVYKDVGDLKKLELIIEDNGQNAHFNPMNKEIRVSKNTLLSIPHEIGHAVEEHGTKFLKQLQRNRGNYTTLALMLYGLGREKSTNKKGKETFIGKIQNTIYKYKMLIPLLAFSPELITEIAASKIGLNYIRTHIQNLKNKPAIIENLKSIEASEKILKAAKKHYAIAFCTYLALPIFAVLDNFIFEKTTKR